MIILIYLESLDMYNSQFFFLVIVFTFSAFSENNLFD